MRPRAALATLAVAVALAAVPAAAADPGAAPPGMVAIPGGSFRAGEPVGHLSDTASYHRVAPFLLDATEVTVSAYAACVKAGRCKPASATIKWEGVKAAEAATWSAFCNRDREDRAEHPVNCVDWSQARDYCAWAGKRLPRAEEWEWAARNGEAGTAYPWGADPPADRACWSGPVGDKPAARRDGTCPVGSLASGDTASGVKDLAGNVWEWTDTADVILPDSRGRGGTPARIARGGGWSDADPRDLAARRRAKDLPGDRAADLGFRCARDR